MTREVNDYNMKIRKLKSFKVLIITLVNNLIYLYMTLVIDQGGVLEHQTQMLLNYTYIQNTVECCSFFLSKVVISFE